MSASEAVIAAVREAMTAHQGILDVGWDCTCGQARGLREDFMRHRSGAIAAAAEAAALEAAAEAVRERVPYNAELRPDGREDPAMAVVVQAHHEVWVWLQERAGEVRT